METCIGMACEYGIYKKSLAKAGLFGKWYW